MISTLEENERKQVFLMLIGLQDCGLGVTSSRSQVAEHYKIATSAVKRIEHEGIEKTWPPLQASP